MTKLQAWVFYDAASEENHPSSSRQGNMYNKRWYEMN